MREAEGRRGWNRQKRKERRYTNTGRRTRRRRNERKKLRIKGQSSEGRQGEVNYSVFLPIALLRHYYGRRLNGGSLRCCGQDGYFGGGE